MYTQCTHCKAVFRVDMKEVTTAKGQLKCGECLQTFHSIDSLSTSKPDKPNFSDTDNSNIETSEYTSKYENEAPDLAASTTATPIQKEKSSKSDKIILASIFLLTFLLTAQILYQNPSLYSNAPPEREPEKVEMLNYNVFAHPSEKGVLLISGTLQNNADHAQPYPTLEVSLSDAEDKIVGLSRFAPEEYLSESSQVGLLAQNKPIHLNLKIKDPGKNATHFKFGFK